MSQDCCFKFTTHNTLLIETKEITIIQQILNIEIVTSKDMHLDCINVIALQI